jgi:hypothetical protein
MFSMETCLHQYLFVARFLLFSIVITHQQFQSARNQDTEIMD